jgi:unsaturated rhamnogalacturonyl hydrolase
MKLYKLLIIIILSLNLFLYDCLYGRNSNTNDNKNKFDLISNLDYSDLEWLTNLANSIIAREPDPSNYEWDWGPGTMMFGMWKAYEATGNLVYYNYVKSYIDTHVYEDGSIYPSYWSTVYLNLAGPGIVLLDIYEATNSIKYLTAAYILANYLKEWPKTVDGGYYHVKPWDQLWIDTLFMTSVFLAKLGNITGDADYMDEAVLQIIVHANKLLDDSEKLFYHAWDEDGSPVGNAPYEFWADPVTHQSPCLWSRGNGWALWTIIEVLDYLPNDHVQKNTLVQMFQNQVAKIVEYQEANTGLWYTVIDEMGSQGNYLETSGSAMFVYSIKKGIVKGYLSGNLNGAVNDGNIGLNGKIYLDGNNLAVVTGISAGTRPGDYDYYVSVEVEDNLFWGLGPYLSAKAIMSSSPSQHSISGKTLYYSNSNPIEDVTVTISTEAIENQNTDASGSYQFNDIAAFFVYTVKPSKLTNTDIGSTTVRTYDAALTAQAAVGILQLSANQTIAADVDRNGKIYTFDASLIAQYAIDLPNASSSFVGEWSFQPDSIIYPSLASDQVDQNFAGIILGDVDGNWTLTNNTKPDTREYHELKDITTMPENEIIIPFIVDNGKKIISLEIDLSYDSDILQILDVEKTDISKEMTLIYNEKPGRLRVAAYCVEPINRAGIIVNVKFNCIAKSAGQSELLLNSLRLNEDVLMRGSSKIVINDGENTPSKYELNQNYPNPFYVNSRGIHNPNQLTHIEYHIPSHERVILKIYNYLGQEIRILANLEQTPGAHKVFWDGRKKTEILCYPAFIYIKFRRVTSVKQNV